MPFTPHELRTPLTGLRSILELLAEGVLADGEVDEFLALALDAVGRLEDLADRIEQAEKSEALCATIGSHSTKTNGRGGAKP